MRRSAMISSFALTRLPIEMFSAVSKPTHRGSTTLAARLCRMNSPVSGSAMLSRERLMKMREMRLKTSACVRAHSIAVAITQRS
jgi:hypothetical protein